MFDFLNDYKIMKIESWELPISMCLCKYYKLIKLDILQLNYDSDQLKIKTYVHVMQSLNRSDDIDIIYFLLCYKIIS